MTDEKDPGAWLAADMNPHRPEREATERRNRHLEAGAEVTVATRAAERLRLRDPFWADAEFSVTLGGSETAYGKTRVDAACDSIERFMAEDCANCASLLAERDELRAKVAAMENEFKGAQK